MIAAAAAAAATPRDRHSKLPPCLVLRRRHCLKRSHHVLCLLRHQLYYNYYSQRSTLECSNYCVCNSALPNERPPLTLTLSAIFTVMACVATTAYMVRSGLMISPCLWSACKRISYSASS